MDYIKKDKKIRNIIIKKFNFIYFLKSESERSINLLYEHDNNNALFIYKIKAQKKFNSTKILNPIIKNESNKVFELNILRNGIY